MTSDASTNTGGATSKYGVHCRITRAGRGPGAASPRAPTSAIVAGLLHMRLDLSRRLGDSLVWRLYARQRGVDVGAQDGFHREPLRRPWPPLRGRGERVRHRLEERERL